MANDLTENPLILDSDGIISTTPISIRWARLLPNALSNAATLKSWDESDVRSEEEQATVTVTGANNLACTGKFTTADVVVGDVIEITNSNTGNNVGTYLVKTRTDDNNIIIDDGGLTNEAGKLYNFKIYKGITKFPFLVSGDSLLPDDFFPAQPMNLANLSLDGIVSGAVLYVYV